MPSITDYLSRAMAYCWDESHGYSQTNDGMGNPDFDCSGLVGRCLYEAGFNYPSYHVGTMNMDDNPMSSMNALGGAGFQLIHVTDLNNIPPLKHGDIIVENSYSLDWQANGGHTFIYAEDIRAYTDPTALSDNIGIVSQAKVEASSSRGHTSAGDSRCNGTGAYWEVWCHAYSQLISSYYDPQSTQYHNYVTIARIDDEWWPLFVAGAMLLPHSYKKRRPDHA